MRPADGPGRGLAAVVFKGRMTAATARAYAALRPRSPLERFEYELGPLGPEDVQIAVETCGLCHSDLSMIDDEWGFSTYPLVAGHEIVGKVTAIGDHVRTVQPGDRVGVGWFAGSCMRCPQCMSGSHNLCPSASATIVGRHGGFADTVRSKAEWAIPLPARLDPKKAGPLFCGGITVFNPLVELDVRPTDRVGVIGIGGLGHLALQFLAKWGCEVTAFTSSAAKAAEARALGAHHAVDSRDPGALAAVAGRFDLILSTVAVDLDWSAYLAALGPKGRLHTVGAVPSPLPIPAFTLISGQRSVSGSPLGAPATVAKMLDFCERHRIEAWTEVFPMSRIDDALEHLRSGRARYRVVLENDA